MKAIFWKWAHMHESYFLKMRTHAWRLFSENEHTCMKAIFWKWEHMHECYFLKMGIHENGLFSANWSNQDKEHSWRIVVLDGVIKQVCFFINLSFERELYVMMYTMRFPLRSKCWCLLSTRSCIRHYQLSYV